MAKKKLLPWSERLALKVRSNSRNSSGSGWWIFGTSPDLSCELGYSRSIRESWAEVAQTDVEDPESLQRGFQGAHAVFCVTFF